MGSLLNVVSLKSLLSLLRPMFYFKTIMEKLTFLVCGRLCAALTMCGFRSMQTGTCRAREVKLQSFPKSACLRRERIVFLLSSLVFFPTILEAAYKLCLVIQENQF